MAERNEMGITIKKQDDMPEWYTQVIQKAQVADYAPIKGCMVLRPLGYSLWENLVAFFDGNIKKLGVKNAYFPMFIPEEYFKREAQHAEGFKAEVAWIERRSEGDVRYAIRPTSEAIISDFFSKWIRSWRDLPLRINQWCNICRWEVQDCKMFLRSREFLWQEGHCVYETEELCHADTLQFLEEYRKVAEDLLAIPVIKGKKTEKEKFAGADRTYTVEALMPDGKALQVGTSHDLGQHFPKAFNIKYIGKDEQEHYPFQNSWGISWRMLGAMIMTHSDDKGLVLPPSIAPNKVVIIPILFQDTKEKVLKKCAEIQAKLGALNPLLDDRTEYTPGWKFNEWELKGVPLRIELGPKDLDKEHCVVVRRDTGKKEFVKLKDIESFISKTLESMHHDMFTKAKHFLDQSIVHAETWSAFEKAIHDKKLVQVPFCCDATCEEMIKEKTQGVTSRCIMKENVKQKRCVHCNKEAPIEVLFGKNY